MRRAALETLRRNGEPDGVLRMTLVPMAPAASRWLLVARRRTGADRPLRLVVLDDLDRPHGPPRDVKCTARDLYDRALARAAAEGADDAVLVDADGSVLESAVGNIWLWVGDRWVTPEADGRLLPGIARGVLLERLADGPARIEARRCSVSELLSAPAVAVSNAVHGPRPAVVRDAQGAADGIEAEMRLGPLLAAWREALGAP
jgi:branched-subunit amino acid aminotransferase/4-amino-4-deoxychorismate lyase